MSGHLSKGRDVLRQVLASIGMRFPRSPMESVTKLAVSRIRLWLRGLQPKQAFGARADTASARAEIYWSIAAGLSVVDPIGGAYFQTKTLLNSLDSGDPIARIRGLSIEAAHRAVAGRRGAAEAEQLLYLARNEAAKLQDPYATAMVSLGESIFHFVQGWFEPCLHSASKAELVLREACVAAPWEVTTAQSFILFAAYYLGEINLLRDRLPNLISEARERGNLYAISNFLTFANYLVLLANDEPDSAKQQLDDVMSAWKDEGYYVPHANAFGGNILIELYSGDPEAAWSVISQEWKLLKRSQLLRVRLFRCYTTFMRGTAALAMTKRVVPARRFKFLREAQQAARWLTKEKSLWANGLGQLLVAGHSQAMGDHRNAIVEYRSAVRVLDDVKMGLVSSAAKCRLAQLCNDEILLNESIDWMRSQGILNPKRMTFMFVPY